MQGAPAPLPQHITALSTTWEGVNASFILLGNVDNLLAADGHNMHYVLNNDVVVQVIQLVIVNPPRKMHLENISRRHFVGQLLIIFHQIMSVN